MVEAKDLTFRMIRIWEIFNASILEWGPLENTRCLRGDFQSPASGETVYNWTVYLFASIFLICNVLSLIRDYKGNYNKLIKKYQSLQN